MHFDPDYHMPMEWGGLREYDGSISQECRARLQAVTHPRLPDVLRNLQCTVGNRFAMVPVTPSDVARTVIDAEVIGDKKSPQIAEVTFEDLGDDLMDGVKTKSVKQVNFTPPLYRIPSKSAPFFHQEVNDSTIDASGNPCIDVDSFVNVNDMPDDDKGVWSVFHRHGLSIIDTKCYNITNGSCKYVKIGQHFKLSLDKDAAGQPRHIVPYLQLICRAKRAKYLGQYYDRDSVITLFVKHHWMPNVPSPALLSVRPQAEQTYVPLMPKQKLQVITDTKLDYNLDADSSIRYVGGHNVELPDVSVLCQYFECIRDPQTQELIFVNSHGLCKTIHVPGVKITAKRGRYPCIMDPVKTSVILAHNIDGFCLRFHRKTHIKIANDCPLKLVYTIDRKDYWETKIRITKPQTCFRLERVKDNWVVRVG